MPSSVTVDAPAGQTAKGASKVLTVRLPQADADRIEFIARVDGISVNDIVRRALEQYVETLRADTDFVTRARARMARENEIASQLV